MMRLQNQTAVITGASRGIGESIARLFHAHGATVVLADILDDEGRALCQQLGDRAHYVHVDVSCESDWQAMQNFLENTFGTITILVNNAGIIGLDSNEPQDPEHACLAAWQHVHRVNLDSVFLGCKMAIRLMKKDGGSIVNMSSRSGLVGVPATAAYASSKAAITNHTRSVALYCAQAGYPIRANAIHPAAILTPMWDEILGVGDKRQASIDAIERTIPLGHMGEPIDVAYAALYLASEESKYVTGSAMVLDGGILAGSAASPHPRPK